VSAVAASRAPDRVAELLAKRETRILGRYVARWVPTEAVRDALLALPLPGDSETLRDHARALAGLGVAEALPTLRRVVEAGRQDNEDGWYTDALAAAEALVA
jgi:hypothetical protein